MQFRRLGIDEAAAFRAWAREHYEPFSEIKGIWHPAVQEECVKINEEHATFVTERKDAAE